MRPREIIEMIESGTPPMDKVPPDNQTSHTPDFGWSYLINPLYAGADVSPFDLSVALSVHAIFI